MNELEKIEAYFKGRMSDPERKAFESALTSDPDLADSVAFYLVAKQAAKAENQAQRRTEWDANRKQAVPVTKRLSLWQYASAAAACLIIIFGLGWYFLNRQTATELADHYIQESYESISQTMDNSADSLVRAKEAFLSARYDEALNLTTGILQKNPDDHEALKLAGFVSLRTEKYDQAIEYFNRLGKQTELYTNPGLFYEALAHLKRGLPMDKNQAKKLLQTVIDKNLDEKTQAEEILSKLD